MMFVRVGLSPTHAQLNSFIRIRSQPITDISWMSSSILFPSSFTRLPPFYVYSMTYERIKVKQFPIKSSKIFELFQPYMDFMGGFVMR